MQEIRWTEPLQRLSSLDHTHSKLPFISCPPFQPQLNSLLIILTEVQETVAQLQRTVGSVTTGEAEGKRVVAKRPRVYLGKTYLFTSPMDYVVRIERKALKYSIMPYLQSSKTRGTGGGFSGAIAWETGALSLGVALWSDIGAEWMIEFEQALGGGFSIKGGIAYS